MAPEALKKQYSFKTDCWAFGVLIFELLTLSEPYAGKDLLEIAWEVRTLELRPEIPKEGPPVLLDLLERCCSFAPESRPEMAHVAVLLAQEHQDAHQ